MLHLGRAEARQLFKAYDAALMAGADKDSRRDWVRVVNLAAGWGDEHGA